MRPTRKSPAAASIRRSGAEEFRGIFGGFRQDSGGRRMSQSGAAMHTTRLFMLILPLALFAGCGGDSVSPTGPTPVVRVADPPDPARVTAYLEELIGIMQTNSANAQRIDWGRFRAEVLAAGAN